MHVPGNVQRQCQHQLDQHGGQEEMMAVYTTMMSSNSSTLFLSAAVSWISSPMVYRGRLDIPRKVVQNLVACFGPGEVIAVPPATWSRF